MRIVKILIGQMIMRMKLYWLQIPVWNDESEIIRNSYQFLCQIAQQKAYGIYNKIPER